MNPEELNNPEWIYKRVGWEERLERISADYGVPEHPYEGKLTGWEDSPEHAEATIF